MKPTYSIVIPCLNEEPNIERTIQGIRSQLNQPKEVVVVDNGSTDNTIDILRRLDCTYYIKEGYNISQLRNYGVNKLLPTDYIVFIDADICLANDWSDVFFDFLKNNQGVELTGNRVKAPGDTWIDKNWFCLLELENSPNYINSGHLIVSSSIFQELGGFNEELITSEDYDFCQRYLKLGRNISHAPKNMIALHYGYPRTIKDFIHRESWHGKSDIKTFNNFITSKVAILSIGTSITVTLAFTMLTLHKWVPSFVFILIYVITLLIATKVKFRSQFRLITSSIMSIYLLSRTLSIFTISRNRS